MLHGAMLGSGTHSCAPAATKHISHIAAGKLTYSKGKGKTTYHHIPQLKGRSKHWDMLLTRRYMLAHIPLTKINILASVLTFTSSFSSHLNHCNHCIYSSLPSIAPCRVHTLPSASTSLPSRSLLSLPGQLLSSLCPWQQPWSLSYSPPQHIKFHPSLQFHLLNCKLLRAGTNMFTCVAWWKRPSSCLPGQVLHNEQRSHLELQAFINRLSVVIVSEVPQDQVCSFFQLISNWFPVQHNLQFKSNVF